MEKHYDQREALHEARVAEQARRDREAPHSSREAREAEAWRLGQCANCGGWHGEHTEGCPVAGLAKADPALKRAIITEWLEGVQKISSDVHERVAATNLLARIRRGG